MSIYIIFVISFFLSYIAYKKNRKIYVVCLVLILSLYIGLRDKSVGDDTETYYMMFSYLKKGIFSPNYEFGFSLLSYLILIIFRSIQAPFVVFAFISNIFIVVRLWELRERFSFPLTIMLYLILYYPGSCNIMRQYISIAIVFWSTRFLEKSSNKLFLICVLIASSIHISAAVSILYIPLYMTSSIHTSSRKKRNYLYALLLLPIIIYVAYYVLINYIDYFLTSNNTFGLFNFVRIAFLLMTIILSPYLFRKDEESVKYNLSDFVIPTMPDRIVLISYIIGTTLYFLGYYKTTIMRIGMYFGIFEILFITLAVKRGRGRSIMKICYFVMLAYYFIVNAKSGWL